MKTHVVFLIIAGILFSCSKDKDPVPLELLTNASMDIGSGRPNSWWHNGAGYYHTAWTDEEANSPQYSLKIYSDTPDSNEDHYAFWAQTFEGVTPVGKDLTFSIKVKADLVGSGINLSIYGHDTVIPLYTSNVIQTVSSSDTQTITGAFDWTTYSVKLTKIQSTVKSITVYVIMNPATTGKVYFDDASLRTN
jgi:hypothetical protein